MFGHCRDRSLIPVKDLEKYPDPEIYEESDNGEDYDDGPAVEEQQIQLPGQRINTYMIYLLFLAEALLASSLSSQIEIIVPSAGCLSMDKSFIRSILECSYFFGGVVGLLWGWAADRLGRRNVAMFGLFGMSVCCIWAVFRHTFSGFAILRFIAGAFGSAVTVPALAMLADTTHGSKSRALIVARLPLIAVCGKIVPLASDVFRQLSGGYGQSEIAAYSGLFGQIACTLFVVIIAALEALLLKETLPVKTQNNESHEASEKAAFLGQSLSNSSNESLSSSIFERISDSDAPSRIGISQMVNVPSVILLLASFSMLSLHSSTFDVQLPHLIELRNDGMGIPCSWLSFVVTGVKIMSALMVVQFVPTFINNIGLLQAYRKVSLVFPLIPLVGFAVSLTGIFPALSAMLGVWAMVVKTTFTGAAEVLVVLLVFSAAPDASSTGTVIGIVSVSQLFKALAVGISGMSYYIAEDYSNTTVNGALWAVLTLTAIIGAAITWRVRETPRVGADIPEECLVWEGMFDADSEDEKDF